MVKMTNFHEAQVSHLDETIIPTWLNRRQDVTETSSSPRAQDDPFG
jgi:hypothetical protein